MVTIHLHNLNFFSFHGIHEEERILGNEYEVNVDVAFDEKGAITKIGDTINYATIFELIKQRMNMPTPLLETVAQDIADNVYIADNRVRSIRVSVEKKNPPIANIQGSVSVSYTKEF
jgi:dihydroneopterin aldolase